MSQQKVYEYIKEHPNSTARDVYTALNTSPQSVQSSLRKLMQYGIISREINVVYRYKVKE